MITMKKLIYVLFIFIIAGCTKSESKYKVYYNVYYPNNTKSYSIITDDIPYLGSDRGTNYMTVGTIGSSTIIKTSAPIEIVRIERLK